MIQVCTSRMRRLGAGLDRRRAVCWVVPIASVALALVFGAAVAGCGDDEPEAKGNICSVSGSKLPPDTVLVTLSVITVPAKDDKPAHYSTVNPPQIQVGGSPQKGAPDLISVDFAASVPFTTLVWKVGGGVAPRGAFITLAENDTDEVTGGELKYTTPEGKTIQRAVICGTQEVQKEKS